MAAGTRATAAAWDSAPTGHVSADCTTVSTTSRPAATRNTTTWRRTNPSAARTRTTSAAMPASTDGTSTTAAAIMSAWAGTSAVTGLATEIRPSYVSG